MLEEWKDIPGYEGKYMVSNTGIVKSLNYAQSGKENIIKNYIDKKGYAQVKISKNGIITTIKVHTIVAMAFLGYTQTKRYDRVIDHIDNNRANNNLINLQIITNRENVSKNRIRRYPRGVVKNNKTKKGKSYAAQFCINNKTYHLGSYNTPEEAGESYNRQLKSLNESGFITTSKGVIVKAINKNLI